MLQELADSSFTIARLTRKAIRMTSSSADFMVCDGELRLPEHKAQCLCGACSTQCFGCAVLSLAEHTHTHVPYFVGFILLSHVPSRNKVSTCACMLTDHALDVKAATVEFALDCKIAFRNTPKSLMEAGLALLSVHHLQTESFEP